MTERATPYDDLLVLERRGRLGVVERRRLEVFTRSSPVSRLMHELGREYDAMQTDRERDDELVARLADAVCERRARRPERRGHGRTLLYAFLAVLGSASAALAGAGLARWGVGERSPETTAPEDHARDGAPRFGASRAAQRPVAESVHEESRAAARGEDAPRAESSSRAPDDDLSSSQEEPKRRRETGPGRDETPLQGVSSPEVASPERMFSEANALRKAGRMNAAVVAYRELASRHPGSAQALLSHVVLGRILLRQGDAQGAFREFSRYLGASPKGSLAEEALYGSTTALRALGRSGEEEKLWRQLLARFPSSIYGDKARARLSELAGEGGALGSRPEPSERAGVPRERRDELP